MFSDVLFTLENYEFKKKTAIDIDSSMQLHHYDIDYYKLRLNVLEKFEEGEFILAKRLKFVRRYVHDKLDPLMYTHMTTVSDITLQANNEQYRGSIGLFHGMSQCSDVYFETAL